MSTLIHDVRVEQGIARQSLADKLGVSVSAVQQYERSESTGSIRVKTLKKVLGALGASYEPSVDRTPPGLRREEALNLALHREIAKKLIDTPDEVRTVARRNIPKIRQNVSGAGPVGLVNEWEQLISGPVNVLLSAMLDESRHGSELRQNTPFAGVLSQDERLSVIRGSRA